MTQEIKLLTEAEWRARLSPHIFEMIQEELRSRGLIAEEPDMTAEQNAAGLTCEEARRLHGDDLPRFMASTPDTILRSYGAVNVTQADIDNANEAIAAWNTRAQETPDAQ